MRRALAIGVVAGLTAALLSQYLEAGQAKAGNGEKQMGNGRPIWVTDLTNPTLARAAKGRKGGSVATESLTIAHEGMKARKPPGLEAKRWRPRESGNTSRSQSQN